MQTVTSCKNLLLIFEELYFPVGDWKNFWHQESEMISDLHHCLEKGHLFADTDEQTRRHRRLHRNLQDLEKELALVREARDLIEREIMKRDANDETTTTRRHDISHFKVIN